MARPETVSRSELLRRLAGVFRTAGYEGASLARLAAESGLARAALYHRYGGGKEEMARAVLADTGREMAATVLRPLAGAGSPRERLEAMRAGLERFYARGGKSCLADLFSVDGTPPSIRDPLAAGLKAWIAAIEKVLGEAGIEPETALRRAEHAVVRVEGSLVLARALGDTGVFARTLDPLVDDLLAEA